MTTSTLFDKTYAALEDAILIAWDGCHKIYLAMDEVEASFFRAEYPHVLEGSPAEMAEVIHFWWDNSCMLRFISAVSHNEEDPNAGFVNLIAQFEDEEDEEDEEEDY